MLFPMGVAGSVPESVKAQWPFWYALMGLLLVLAIMDCITVQIIGVILNVLMIGLAYLIVRKDFEMAPSTTMMYGVLMVLNLVFGLIPLIQDLGGRKTVTDGPATSVVVNGVKTVEVQRIVTKHSFFSGSEGFKYNLESAHMLLAPLVMLFGTVLTFKAAYDIGQTAPDDEDVEGQGQGFAGGSSGGGYGGTGAVRTGNGALDRAVEQDNGLDYWNGGGAGGNGGAGGGGARGGGRSGGRSGGGQVTRGGPPQNFQAFSGEGQTLGR